MQGKQVHNTGRDETKIKLIRASKFAAVLQTRFLPSRGFTHWALSEFVGSNPPRAVFFNKIRDFRRLVFTIATELRLSPVTMFL